MPDTAPSALRPSVTAATSVAALAGAVGARLLGDDAVVHGVEQRSNAVQAGDLFAALPGTATAQPLRRRRCRQVRGQSRDLRGLLQARIDTAHRGRNDHHHVRRQMIPITHSIPAWV